MAEYWQLNGEWHIHLIKNKMIHMAILEEEWEVLLPRVSLAFSSLTAAKSWSLLCPFPAEDIRVSYVTSDSESLDYVDFSMVEWQDTL